MAKYKTETSKETIMEAEGIAKATQRPGQTKEQTKLIAQGIQKGIEQYKKAHKAKSRELNKKLKSIESKKQNKPESNKPAPVEFTKQEKYSKPSKLPWLLLVASWLMFGAYYFVR